MTDVTSKIVYNTKARRTDQQWDKTYLYMYKETPESGFSSAKRVVIEKHYTFYIIEKHSKRTNIKILIFSLLLNKSRQRDYVILPVCIKFGWLF